jgi:hypothetical protein
LDIIVESVIEGLKKVKGLFIEMEEGLDLCIIRNASLEMLIRGLRKAPALIRVECLVIVFPLMLLPLSIKLGRL